jgi:hypothetical protein
VSVAVQALEKAESALRELFEARAVVQGVLELVRDFKRDTREQQRVFQAGVEDRILRTETSTHRVSERLDRIEERADDRFAHRIAVIEDRLNQRANDQISRFDERIARLERRVEEIARLADEAMHRAEDVLALASQGPLSAFKTKVPDSADGDGVDRQSQALIKQSGE